MKPIQTFDDSTVETILQIVRDYRAGKLASGKVATPHPHETKHALYFINDSGEEVPPFACMRIKRMVSNGDLSFLEIAKPDTSLAPISKYAFNGPDAVASGEFGKTQQGEFFRIRNNSGSTTVGVRWNPTSNQWYLTQSAGGIFYSLGSDNIATDVLRVRPDVVWRYFGKVASAIEPDDTGTMTIWTDGKTSTGLSLTVYNPASVDVPENTSRLLAVSRDPETYNWILDTEFCE